MAKLRQKISSLTKSKDARTVASNFVWLSLLQVASYIFPLITMPYLAHVIGVEGFGKIAFAMAIMVWIQTIADWGFNLTATRDVAQNRDNSEKVSEIFSNVLWARCLLMFVSLAVLLLLIAVIPAFREDWDVILVSFLIIPGHILFPDWFFQAVEKMKYITILNVLTKLLFTLAVFVFIKEPDDYIIQPLLSALGFAVSGIIAQWIIIGRWGYKIVAPEFGTILATIKKSTDVFINNLAPNLYNSLSIVLLGIFSGGVANGIYDGANKFMNILCNILNTITRAFFPFLSRKGEHFKLYVRMMIFIAVAIGAAMWFVAPWLVNTLLSSEFAESVVVIRILSISLIFYVMASAYGSCNLIINHRERVLRQLTVLCSVAGLLMAIPLIYFYSYIGVAITVTASRALLGISSWWIANTNINDIYARCRKQASIFPKI